MTTLSYNDEQYRASELRHFFIPPVYGLVAETIIAVVALVIFNLSTLSDQLLAKNSGTTANPLSAWSTLLDELLTSLQQHTSIQRVLLFMLWAFAGALAYVLIFRLGQLFIRARRSVHQGAELIQTEHGQGAAKWLGSLHDFFLKLILVLGGTAAILTGVLICFAIASQELAYALADSLPLILLDLLLGFIAAVLSVRLVVIGISLLSQRFRIWYNS
jgi:hypothetical protein